MSMKTPVELRALAEAAIARGDNNVPNLDPTTLLRLLDLAEQMATELDDLRARLAIVAEHFGFPELLTDESSFLAASVAVWREIDRLTGQPEGYKGLAPDTDLRLAERAAWERYRGTLAAVDAAVAERPQP